jgi:hypothetical protein
VVEDPALVERLLALVRDVLHKVEEASQGVLFTLPVSSFARLKADRSP